MIAAIILVLLQFADWWTTRTILIRGGRELNPVARAGMRLLGMDGYLGVKVAWVTVLSWLALTHIKGAVYGLAALCALYGWVAWRHLRILRGRE